MRQPTMRIKNKLTLHILCFLALIGTLQAHPRYDAIHSGIALFDQNNKEVNAHGACIVKEGNKYYLFGEYKSDTANVFVGFSCYSSSDLKSWSFERIVLPEQSDGLLGPNRVGERVKVMKCPQTGEFVMYMHTDNKGYSDPNICYATCKTINGNYKFQGSLLHEGKPIRKWDMGTFQDTDGKGYLLIHHGLIYELSSDYKSAKIIVVSHQKGGESPTIFKHKGIYYWLSSDLTGWERNDNMYMTATSLKGPWTFRGLFAPKDSLTWNSQCSFVLPVAGKKDTLFMYMGDRWSHPKQGTAATYVWQPFRIERDSISLPDFKQNWKINPSTGEWTITSLNGRILENTDKAIHFSGVWQHSSITDKSHDSRSDEKGATFSIDFIGTQIGLYCTSRPDGGYAQAVIRNSKGKIVLSSAIDMYCKYPENSLKFLSPKFRKDRYTLTVSVLGERWWWVEKSGRKSGSQGSYISIDKVLVK